MNRWTKDYTELQEGDEFELEGVSGLYVVQDVQIYGGDCIGSWDSTVWLIETNAGRFKYEPRLQKDFRGYRIVRSGVEVEPIALLNEVYSEDALEWKGFCKKQETRRQKLRTEEE